MADIHLTMGINDYDHVRDLFTGAVKPVGIEITSLVMEVEETFKRFLQNQEWDTYYSYRYKYPLLTIETINHKSGKTDKNQEINPKEGAS